MSAMMERPYTGPERAAILLLALGEEHGKPVWNTLSEEEIRTVSAAMSGLGTVEIETVDQTLGDFVARLNRQIVSGGKEQTHSLLARVLPQDRADQIMKTVGAQEDRVIWNRLSQMHEMALVSYLRNELPPAAAVVIGRLNPTQAARVLARLPTAFAVAVLDRMLSADPISREVLDQVENTMRNEFANLIHRSQSSQTVERVVEIVARLEKPVDQDLLAGLERVNPDATRLVRGKMFTFDDVARLESAALQLVIGHVDRDVLARALKGSSDTLKRPFFAAMSTRAARNLMDSITDLRPLRLREVHEARDAVVQAARELDAERRLVFERRGADDPLVY